MSFGEELKRIRESKGMTVNQLAVYSKVSSASISRYERGERGTPKPPTIEKLAAGLKMDYQDLMKIAGYVDEIGKIGEDEQDASTIFNELNELILKYTDDEIISNYAHTISGKKLNDEQIRKILSYVRFVLNSEK